MKIKEILAAIAIVVGMAAVAAAASGTCLKAAKLRGGGQNPNSVDLQIQTKFAVMGDGCIVDFTDSTLTVTSGTKLLADFKAGRGPNPTSGTWKGVSVPTDINQIIECPDAAGEVGQLILDNKDGGGKDADRITIMVR